MSDHAAIRIRLIGPMGAWAANDENVLPPGRKTRALLACVAMAAPRPVLRSWLIEHLWSRSSEKQGRASLRQEVHRLLDALAPAEADILIVARGHLAFRPSAVSTDLQEVTQADSTRPSALSLLDADLLEDLEGIDPNFDAWLQGERARLRNRALRIAESMLHDITGPDDAIEAAERVLTIDRVHEGAWRALMTAHHARSERGLAIRAYNRCRAALADTVDAMPSAETQKLLYDIRGPSYYVTSAVNPGLPQEPTTASTSRRDVTMMAEGTHIGVMPFRLISSGTEHVSLAQGLADEIANALSKFRWMSILSSDSLDRFATDNRDEAAISRELGLDFLLDGSVQRAASKIRVSLQLLDLRSNAQVVWARRFDRQNDDSLSLQDEIAAEVAAQIDPEIPLIEAKRSTSHKPTDPTAYDLMLRAIPLIGQIEQEPFMLAGRYLAEAIDLEPDQGQSYAWYAYWHIFLTEQHWAKNPTAIIEKANVLAERATVLDPLDARGLAVSGHVRAILHRRLPEAMMLHDRALSLNPNLAMAWALSAAAHAYAGDLDEAERRNDRYKTLSPFDPHGFFFDACFVLVRLLKRDYQTAVDIGRGVVELNPSFSAAYKPYLAALGHLRRDREATSIRRRLLGRDPYFTIERFLEDTPIERECDKMHYPEGLRLAGIPTALRG
jgi:TolB-like protein/DNA-binding SARP family transcriptional activator